LGGKVLLVNLDEFGLSTTLAYTNATTNKLTNQSKRKEKNSTIPILKET